jgi:DNA modification methylase
MQSIFDLDSWFKAKLPEQAQKTFPALIVPKPHKNEKSKYIENTHPTVKPLKLMSYLITMGSREGDLVLDPFCGSGTTLEAANMLKRRFTGCELDEKWKPIIEARAFKRSKAV